MGEKAQKSRNSRSVSGRVVGAEGVVTNLSKKNPTLNQILKECLCYHIYTGVYLLAAE